jgi:hypothetical protein
MKNLLATMSDLMKSKIWRQRSVSSSTFLLAATGVAAAFSFGLIGSVRASNSQFDHSNKCKIRISVALTDIRGIREDDRRQFGHSLLQRLNGGITVQATVISGAYNERNAKERARQEGYDFLLTLSLSVKSSLGWECYVPGTHTCPRNTKVTAKTSLWNLEQNSAPFRKEIEHKSPESDGLMALDAAAAKVVEHVLNVADSSGKAADLPTPKQIFKKFACVTGLGSQPRPQSVTAQLNIEAPFIPGGRAAIDLYEQGAKWRIDARTREDRFTILYDGSRGWAKNANEVQEAPQNVLEDFMAFVLMLDAFWDPDSIWNDDSQEISRARTAGLERLQGRDTYVIAAEMRDGSSARLYIDRDTSLLAMVRQGRQTFYYSDYQRVGSLLLPFTFRGVEGRETFSMQIVNLQLNERLPSDLFRP